MTSIPVGTRGASCRWPSSGPAVRLRVLLAMLLGPLMARGRDGATKPYRIGLLAGGGSLNTMEKSMTDLGMSKAAMSCSRLEASRGGWIGSMPWRRSSFG